MTSNKIDFSHLCLKPDDVDCVIYHGGCVDGFGSAFSAWLYLNKKYPERKVEYYPASFNRSPPDVSGKNVAICDFSYKASILNDMITKAKSLIILDHHKTALEELKNIPDKHKLFKMDNSGAYLTWCYFFGEETIPKLIQYIQDNDIWTKKLPNTNEISAYIFTVPKTFEEYEKLIDDKFFDTIIAQAEGMKKQNDTYIDNNLKYVSPKFMEINKSYYFVGHINATTLKSEMGNKSLDRYKLLDFSAVYSIDDYTNSTLMSLRSVNERVDVSEIAKLYGGGGHRNASGIKINTLTTTIPGSVLDNYKLYHTIKNLYTRETKLNGNILNGVYLNTTHCKSELAQYLMQKHNNIQNCVKIMNVVNEELKQKLNTNNEVKDSEQNKQYEMKINICDYSVIWNYDGFNNVTWFTVCLNKDLDQKVRTEITEIMKTYDNYNYNDIRHVFTMNGLINELSFVKKTT